MWHSQPARVLLSLPERCDTPSRPGSYSHYQSDVTLPAGPGPILTTRAMWHSQPARVLFSLPERCDTPRRPGSYSHYQSDVTLPAVPRPILTTRTMWHSPPARVLFSHQSDVTLPAGPGSILTTKAMCHRHRNFCRGRLVFFKRHCHQELVGTCFGDPLKCIFGYAACYLACSYC